MVPLVSRLPAASGASVPVAVHDIPGPVQQTGRCRRWMELVQPAIAADPARADRNWDWRWQIPLIAFGGGLRRGPRLVQLCRAQDDFPLGMLALLENERAIGQEDRPAVYVWYLTAAPRSAVPGGDPPGRIGRAVLDIAATIARNGPAGGRLWLHAAQEGGAGLMDWYRNQGLEAVPGDVSLPQPAIGSRPNDGRYFHLTPERASRAFRDMDEFRP